MESNHLSHCVGVGQSVKLLHKPSSDELKCFFFIEKRQHFCLTSHSNPWLLMLSWVWFIFFIFYFFSSAVLKAFKLLKSLKSTRGWTLLSGKKAWCKEFQFVQKVFIGVKFRDLCRPFNLFYSNIVTTMKTWCASNFVTTACGGLAYICSIVGYKSSKLLLEMQKKFNSPWVENFYWSSSIANKHTG